MLTIEARRRNVAMGLTAALALLNGDPQSKPMINARSGRAAVMAPSRSIMLEDGSVQPCVFLIRPMGRMPFELHQLDETHWDDAEEQAFAAAWNDEVALFRTSRSRRCI